MDEQEMRPPMDADTLKLVLAEVERRIAEHDNHVAGRYFPPPFADLDGIPYWLEDRIKEAEAREDSRIPPMDAISVEHWLKSLPHDEPMPGKGTILARYLQCNGLPQAWQTEVGYIQYGAPPSTGWLKCPEWSRKLDVYWRMTDLYCLESQPHTHEFLTPVWVSTWNRAWRLQEVDGC